jgi:large subunit ribosomal protein L29
MRAGELRQQSVEELRQKERDLVDQLFVLRLHKVTGQLEKPSRVSEVRRDLARVLTVLGEMESAARPAGGVR